MIGPENSTEAKDHPSKRQNAIIRIVHGATEVLPIDGGGYGRKFTLFYIFNILFVPTPTC